jgi:LysR family transcriptional regulator of gallate degradation
MSATSTQARLNLRHLAVFREVARRGGVNAAARALFLSQPAATQAVAAVERYFGAALFARQSTGMVATAAGQLALARIERALAELHDGAPDGLRRQLPDGGMERGVTAAQLDALIAVVAHGGFGAAARTAGVARPTLHRAARALERATGVALFERTSFGVRATRDGERLARRTQLAYAEIAQARAEVAALAGAETGRTVIGVMPLARSVLVPKAVLEFANSYPAHAVALLDGTYESLLAALRAGAADVLVGALRDPAPANDVAEERLFDDPLAIVVRARHPLVGRSAPGVAALAQYPWIAPRAGSPLRRQFGELFARDGVPAPRNPIECNSLVAARALLLDSDRVMLLSAHQIQHELASGTLVALPHPHGRVVRAIGLTTRIGWRPTAAQQQLLRAIREAARRVVAP